MSEEAERIYLTKKMKDSAGDLDFPIAYPNHDFDVPKNAPYGEFFIISGPKPIIAGGEGKGKVRVRYVGMVQLTVWVPKDKGTKIGSIAADTFKGIFQFKLGRDESGSVYCFEAFQKATPDSKAGWACFVFRVPFHRDTIEVVQVSE